MTVFDLSPDECVTQLAKTVALPTSTHDARLSKYANAFGRCKPTAEQRQRWDDSFDAALVNQSVKSLAMLWHWFELVRSEHATANPCPECTPNERNQ